MTTPTKPATEKEFIAYDEGRQAYDEDLTLQDNPYSAQTQASLKGFWDEGFRNAGGYADEEDSLEEDTELFDADPSCSHVVRSALGGGIKCTKCAGWHCL